MAASLNHILYPHHVSLLRSPFALQSLFHAFADRIDPYYEYDRMPSTKGVWSPRFNVTETQASFILDGELPGVTEKKSIRVMWLQNQVLIISGEIPPSDTETGVDPFKTGALQSALQLPKGKLRLIIFILNYDFDRITSDIEQMLIT
jgi:HSP20 family molecular chaperone IbpA